MLLALAAVACGNAELDPSDIVPGAVRGSAEIDGVRWQWVEVGSGDAVLLLHGVPGTWYTWRAQMIELAADHRVIAPDLKGLAGSRAGDGDYSFAGVAGDLGRLLRSLGITRLRLVGHDLGAHVASHLAAAEPDLVAAYLHVAAGIERIDLGRLPDHRDFLLEPSSVEALLRDPEVFVTRVLDAGVAGGADAIDQEARDRYAAALSAGRHRAALSRYFRDLELSADWRPAGRSAVDWSRLTMPVILVVGDRDLLVPLEEYRRAAELIPGFRRLAVIDDAGHYPHEESPAAFNAVMRELFGER